MNFYFCIISITQTQESESERFNQTKIIILYSANKNT